MLSAGNYFSKLNLNIFIELRQQMNEGVDIDIYIKSLNLLLTENYTSELNFLNTASTVLQETVWQETSMMAVKEGQIIAM